MWQFPTVIKNKDILALEKTKASCWNLKNHTCNIGECIEFIDSKENKLVLNFSELARTYQWKNIEGKDKYYTWK